MPLDYNQASWLVAVECNIFGFFPYNTLKLGDNYAEEYMRDFTRAITEIVYPYVTENGSLEGYFELCRRRNSRFNGLGDINELYRQAATAIVLERPEDAREALDRLRQSVDSRPIDDRGWIRELYVQAGALRDRLIEDPAAVREDLLAGMDEQKRRRKIPLSG
ncbi:hypothetical protein [Paractinoplanes toevensis]|nr:hypothetical protein [Actinoplanes toevensis]